MFVTLLYVLTVLGVHPPIFCTFILFYIFIFCLKKYEYIYIGCRSHSPKNAYLWS